MTASWPNSKLARPLSISKRSLKGKAPFKNEAPNYAGKSLLRTENLRRVPHHFREFAS
jgi:hypothetical protein